MKMDEKRLREIRERCEKAEPGPWSAFIDASEGTGVRFNIGTFGLWMASLGHIHLVLGDVSARKFIPPALGEFIAHAREDVPDLLEALAEMGAELVATRAARDRAQATSEASLHDAHCNVAGAGPMGCPGCSCFMYKRAKAAEAERDRLEADAIRELCQAGNRDIHCRDTATNHRTEIRNLTRSRDKFRRCSKRNHERAQQLKADLDGACGRIAALWAIGNGEVNGDLRAFACKALRGKWDAARTMEELDAGAGSDPGAQLAPGLCADGRSGDSDGETSQEG